MTLTSEQSQVVATARGHTVVLAGPGSGKTHTITEKILFLFDQDVVPDPYGVLAITFTNAAANEMRSRLRSNGFRQWDRVWIGTFHSFGFYLLSCYGSDVGVRENFVVIEAEDRTEILNQLASSTPNSASASNIGRTIENLKRRGIYPSRNDNGLPESLRSAYHAYQEMLNERNALDFGDLVALSLRLLQESPLARRLFTTFFRYVIVDEFQDTDPQQLQMVHILAETSLGSTIVADDDQSIYRFRGAERANVYAIERLLNAQRVVLGANFRSDQVIVEAANAVIGFETNRAEKQIVAVSPDRGHLFRCVFPDPGKEAQQVAKWIMALEDQGLIDDWGETAIITRARWRANYVISELDRRKIPWFDRTRLSFEDSWETCLGLAVLRLSCSLDSSDALYHVMDAVECGGLAFRLGDEDALDVAQRIRERLKANADCVPDAAEVRNILDIAEVERIIRTVSWSDTEADHLLKNLYAMATDVSKEAKALDLSLAESVDRFAGCGAVQIMSGHGAKGREFEQVFFVGLEDGTLPSHHARAEDAIAEERRIFYVGLTRARKAAYLTSASELPTQSGYPRKMNPSRFIDHIPTELFSPIPP